MGKFDKKDSCEYCEEKMDSKYRNKRFCSDRCRVYWNREDKKKSPPPVKEAKSENKGDLSSWEKLRNKRLGLNK
jgi:hypothetical protein